MEKISVLLVDDNERLRDTLKFMLGRDQRFAVVGEARNGLEAYEMTSRLQPSIIIMDIDMKPVNGIEATTRISYSFPKSKIIAFSFHDSQTYINGILNAGARSFLSKNAGMNDIINSILTVHLS
jgi:DNA-binding NarL/FixJ family response regulator